MKGIISFWTIHLESIFSKQKNFKNHNNNFNNWTFLNTKYVLDIVLNSFLSIEHSNIEANIIILILQMWY